MMSFIRGQVVLAKVIELVSREVVIVSIYGKLMRVINESGRVIELNEVIELKVLQTSPLQFKMCVQESRLDILL
jgi:hypothetical protein